MESPAIDDPFERLPEHILHDTLSLLPSNKEVARTALISRSWRRAWSSYPLSSFDLKDFRKYRDDMHHNNERFLNFVDRSMSRLREQRMKLPRLKLRAGIVEIDRLPSLCDKWIDMALDDGAQELNLDIHTENPDLRKLGWSYLIPARVLSSDFLKSLTITSATLTSRRKTSATLIAPLDGIATVNLNSLRSLNFSTTYIDDQGLQKLLRGCPLLENLELSWCFPLTQIIIHGLNFLRTVGVRLRVCSVARVEIEAPCLEKFRYNNHALDDTIVLDGCRRLKHLKLYHSTIDDGLFQELLFQLPLLESLTIGFCRQLRRFRISNSLLKKIEKFLGEAAIIRMGKHTSLSYCEADLKIYRLPFDDDWFLRLRKFLIRSRTRSLSLTVHLGGDVQPPNCMLPSFPCDIDQLKLDVLAPQSTHAAIFEGLLSACRPTTMRVIPCGSNSSFLMMICKKLANRAEDTTCRCSRHSKCCLHELKGVDIERVRLIGCRGPLDWCSLFDLLPTLRSYNEVLSRLHW